MDKLFVQATWPSLLHSLCSAEPYYDGCMFFVLSCMMPTLLTPSCYINFLFAFKLTQCVSVFFFLLGSQLLLSTNSSSEVSEPEGYDIGTLLAQKSYLIQIGRLAKYLLPAPIWIHHCIPEPNKLLAPLYLHQFKLEWVQSFPWLHYSKHTDGAFCRVCA